jgi:hypothetical protein
MPEQSPNSYSSDLLVRILQEIGPSLALFIDDSGIWSRPGAEEIKLAIADLCTDLRSLYERAGVLLDGFDLPAPQVEYPIRFTALHDIDLGYLLPQLQRETRSQIAAFEAVGERTGDAGELLREARITLQSHADVLDQLVTKLAHNRVEAAKPSPAS